MAPERIALRQGIPPGFRIADPENRKSKSRAGTTRSQQSRNTHQDRFHVFREEVQKVSLTSLTPFFLLQIFYLYDFRFIAFLLGVVRNAFLC